MRTRTPRLALLLSAALLALAAAAPARAATITTVAPGNQLLLFNSANPNTIISSTQITGLGMGEEILGIDVRPATGQLYALGNSNRLYTINLSTGAATPVGSPGQFTLDGGDFGFDFNPVADRLRVVSDADQDLLLDPNTGMQVGPQPDVFFMGGADPNLVGSAYSNNLAGASSTTLFGLDSMLDAIVRQNELSGELVQVGPLGVNPGDLVGFDIAPDGTAYFIAGFPGASFFHLLNLTTGQATSVGGPMSQQNLDGLAVVPDPTSPGTGNGMGDMGGTTGGGPGPAGDFDLDRDVDLDDLATLLNAPLGEDGKTIRIETPDGVIEGERLVILAELLANFGRTSSAAQRRLAVIARRRATLTAPQGKRVRLRLTRAGRRLYRGYERKRIRVVLRLKATYRPSSGEAVQRRTFRKPLRLRVVKPKRRR